MTRAILTIQECSTHEVYLYQHILIERSVSRAVMEKFCVINTCGVFDDHKKYSQVLHRGCSEINL